MMYDRRKGVHGRYGNVPILSSGVLYCTLRVSLKVLEIWIHLQKIFAEEALVAETCWPCPNKQVTIILITIFATSHMCSLLFHFWKSPIIYEYFKFAMLHCRQSCVERQFILVKRKFEQELDSALACDSLAHGVSEKTLQIGRASCRERVCLAV